MGGWNCCIDKKGQNVCSRILPCVKQGARGMARTSCSCASCSRVAAASAAAGRPHSAQEQCKFLLSLRLGARWRARTRSSCASCSRTTATPSAAGRPANGCCACCSLRSTPPPQTSPRCACRAQKVDVRATCVHGGDAKPLVVMGDIVISEGLTTMLLQVCSFCVRLPVMARRALPGMT